MQFAILFLWMFMAAVTTVLVMHQYTKDWRYDYESVKDDRITFIVVSAISLLGWPIVLVFIVLYHLSKFIFPEEKI